MFRKELKKKKIIEHYSVGTMDLKNGSILDKMFTYRPYIFPLTQKFAVGSEDVGDLPQGASNHDVKKTNLDKMMGVPFDNSRATSQQVKNLDFSNYFKV